MKTTLTIGFFDGVHLGHQALLKKLKNHPHSTILTFTNHPQSLFNPPPPPLLIPLNEKIELLKQYADEVIALPFTLELAATPFEELLSQFELAHLILGQNSAFGKNREGDEEKVKLYAKENNFTVEYIDKLFLDGEPVSSSRIRKALANKNHQLVNQLLGRI